MYVARSMVKYLVKFDLFKIILRRYQNHTPTLPKSHSDFTKITLRFSQNHWLIFTTSQADFHKITFRLYQNHSPTLLYQNHTPTLPKSLADFHNITGWFSQNHTPTLPKSHSDFTKIADWFSQITDWFSQKRGLILKPQIVVLLYAVSKSHPPPLCVLLVRRFQRFRHEPVG